MSTYKVEITKFADVNIDNVIEKTIETMLDILDGDEQVEFDDIPMRSREAFVDALVEEFKNQMQYLK